jgi:two-component system OmpR family sensor kinase
MAVLLAGLGLFVFLRMGAELDAGIEQGLRSRAADLTALVRESDTGLAQSTAGPGIERGEHVAQILDSSGRVLDATPGLQRRPLLTPAALTRARSGTVLLDIDRIPGGDDPARLLATPVRAQERDVVVVVGTPLDDRNDALRNLAGVLLLGGPVALLLASLAGYAVAASALRPVERMRRRAAEIQEAGSGQRLPVPPSSDEVGRLGETLNGMLERLDAAFARERTFVSDASHELRTPLAILKAELELALRSGRGADELRAALESAAEETDRLVQLAEDLLVLARSDQGGGLPLRPEPADARDVLDAVAGRFLGRAGRQHAELAVTAGEGLRIEADRLRLEQAVGNLVDNALRHGGRRIELAAEDRGERVALAVRDDGAGFPEEFLDTAFERFTRADSARGRGGTGLGLAIVAAIVRAHGGSAGARNLPGGGAEVWIELPGGPPREPGGRRAPDREAV